MNIPVEVKNINQHKNNESNNDMSTMFQNNSNVKIGKKKIGRSKKGAL